MKFKRRMNFLPTLISAVLFWASLLLFVFFIPPENQFLIAVFYSLLFISCFITFSIILANSRRGFLVSLAIISFLWLKQIGQAHLLNLILITAILLSIELYFFLH